MIDELPLLPVLAGLGAGLLVIAALSWMQTGARWLPPVAFVVGVLTTPFVLAIQIPLALSVLELDFGALAASGAIEEAPEVLRQVFGSIAGGQPVLASLVVGFGLAGLPEEVLKLIGTLLVATLWRRAERAPTVLVAALCVGVGFATAENSAALAGLQAGDEGNWLAVFVRVFGGLGAHGAIGLVMGGCLALAAHRPHHRGRWYLAALLLPVLLHGMHDAVHVLAVLIDDISVIQTAALAVLAIAVLGAEVGLAWTLGLSAVSVGAGGNGSGKAVGVWRATGVGLVALALLIALLYGQSLADRPQLAPWYVALLTLYVVTYPIALGIWLIRRTRTSANRPALRAEAD